MRRLVAGAEVLEDIACRGHSILGVEGAKVLKSSHGLDLYPSKVT